MYKFGYVWSFWKKIQFACARQTCCSLTVIYSFCLSWAHVIPFIPPTGICTTHMHPHALYMPPFEAAKSEPDFPSCCSSPCWCALPAAAAAAQKQGTPNIRHGNEESAVERTGRQTETRQRGDRSRLLVVLSLSIPLSPGSTPKTCRQMLCFITLQKGTTGEHYFWIIIRTSK